MRIDLVTIFPAFFAPLSMSLLGRARQAGLAEVNVHDLRAWTEDPHRSVDDRPYGGGPGMVMRPEPWGAALEEICGRTGAPLVLVPSPSGRPLRQVDVARYAALPRLVIACARYEGIDARVLLDARQRGPVEEISIGDYVLAGGESAAIVIVEAVTRLLPGVVGNGCSVEDESFSTGLLEGPVFTRPPSWRGLDVPAVLVSGDHQAVARWRREQSLLRTASRRPELLAAAALSPADERFLAEQVSQVASDVAQ